MSRRIQRLADSISRLLRLLTGRRWQRNNDHPPPHFRDFLDRFILTSFLQRQTPQQAQWNLRRFLRTSQLDFILRLADIRRVAYNLNKPGGPWPSEDFRTKKKRKMSMGEKKERLDRLVGAAINEYDQKVNPNYDSDDDNIDEDEEGDGIPDYQYPIERIRRLYSKFARNEIWEAIDREIELQEVLGIISLPHFARVSCLQYILFPFDTLKVTIGFRKVNIRIGNSETDEEFYAQYEWSRHGCIVRYPTTFYTVWGARYQSIAARDFFSLISNPTLVLQKLEFDIEPYDAENRQKWPLTSFFWKVKNYLNTIDYQLRVRRFQMKFFERRKQERSRTREQGMVTAVLEVLTPGILEYIGLSIWKNEDSDYTVDLLYLGHLEQWRKCRQLNIYDDHIRVHEYDLLENFRIIDMILPDEDVDLLLMTLGNSRPLEPWLTAITVQPELDLHRALRILRNCFVLKYIPDHITVEHDTVEGDRPRFKIFHTLRPLFQFSPKIQRSHSEESRNSEEESE